MPLRRKKESVLEDDAFNLTPLIDCVFLLLIFFMVTTVFKNPAALKLTLPIAQNPSKLDKRQIVAELDEEGGVAINSEEVSFDVVDSFLMQKKRELGINSLLIKADKNAKHKDVIKLMMIARTVEIEGIALAVDTPKEDE